MKIGQCNLKSYVPWDIERRTLIMDWDSGTVNDPNGWFDDSRDLVTAIKRPVYVSVESARIIDNLPLQINHD